MVLPVTPVLPGPSHAHGVPHFHGWCWASEDPQWHEHPCLQLSSHSSRGLPVPMATTCAPLTGSAPQLPPAPKVTSSPSSLSAFRCVQFSCFSPPLLLFILISGFSSCPVLARQVLYLSPLSTQLPKGKSTKCASNHVFLPKKTI
jgi:hypothetical protein